MDVWFFLHKICVCVHNHNRSMFATIVEYVFHFHIHLNSCNLTAQLSTRTYTFISIVNYMVCYFIFIPISPFLHSIRFVCISPYNGIIIVCLIRDLAYRIAHSLAFREEWSHFGRASEWVSERASKQTTQLHGMHTHEHLALYAQARVFTAQVFTEEPKKKKKKQKKE